MTISLNELSTLKFAIHDAVAHVTLHRPDVRNAFHPSMIKELTAVFGAVAARTDIAAVVLRGEGKSFCSGADLGYMKSMAGFSFDENLRDSDDLYAMFAAIRDCPQPVLARLHGHVMGGGVGLAACADIGVAVVGTQFCFSEVKLGLVPAVISSFVLDKMHVATARRYMLTGEIFGVEEALRGGLVEGSGDEAAVDEFIDRVLSVIRQNGPEAVRVTKALIRQVQSQPDESSRRALTTRTIAERRISAEGQEGLKGFLEKRAPSWRR